MRAGAKTRLLPPALQRRSAPPARREKGKAPLLSQKQHGLFVTRPMQKAAPPLVFVTKRGETFFDERPPEPGEAEERGSAPFVTKLHWPFVTAPRQGRGPQIPFPVTKAPAKVWAKNAAPSAPKDAPAFAMVARQRGGPRSPPLGAKRPSGQNAPAFRHCRARAHRPLNKSVFSHKKSLAPPF